MEAVIREAFSLLESAHKEAEREGDTLHYTLNLRLSYVSYGGQYAGFDILDSEGNKAGELELTDADILALNPEQA